MAMELEVKEHTNNQEGQRAHDKGGHGIYDKEGQGNQNEGTQGTHVKELELCTLNRYEVCKLSEYHIIWYHCIFMIQIPGMILSQEKNSCTFVCDNGKGLKISILPGLFIYCMFDQKVLVLVLF